MSDDRPIDAAPTAKGPDAIGGTRDRIRIQLIRETEAMMSFAMSSGVTLPPETLANFDAAMSGVQTSGIGGDPTWLPGIADVHATLAAAIAPATPGALVQVIEDRRNNRLWNSFGSVPIVRRMLAVAVVSLVCLLATALSEEINANNMNKGLLHLDGLPLLFIETFLASAASVGASLANLKRLDRYISSCTYDPRFDSSYWTRLVMGIISGIVLSQVLFSALVGHVPAEDDPGGFSGIGTLGQPILALIGGFSGELVHDILTHFISAIGQVFGLGRAATAKKPNDP